MSPSPQHYVAFQGALRLQDWSETSNGGHQVVFLVEEGGDHPFKKFTVRDKKIAGQRFSAFLNLKDAQETEVFRGDMMLLRWGVTPKGGRTVRFLIEADSKKHPLEGYAIGKVDGELFSAAFVEIGADELPVYQAPAPETDTAVQMTAVQKPLAEIEAAKPKISHTKLPETKPFGEFAVQLHRRAWFLDAEVIKAAGDEDDYFEWLKTQACLHVGCLTCEAYMATGDERKYSAVPVCSEHRFNTPIPDKARNTYLKLWVEQRISANLDVESLGYADPAALITWARGNKVFHTLPAIYKEYAMKHNQHGRAAA